MTKIIVQTCKNCKHFLWQLSGMFDGVKGDVEHWNRPYPNGRKYPFSTRKCHAPDCSCENPEKGKSQSFF